VTCAPVAAPSAGTAALCGIRVTDGQKRGCDRRGSQHEMFAIHDELLLGWVDQQRVLCRSLLKPIVVRDI
jgi:hypothetical protein